TFGGCALAPRDLVAEDQQKQSLEGEVLLVCEHEPIRECVGEIAKLELLERRDERGVEGWCAHHRPPFPRVWNALSARMNRPGGSARRRPSSCAVCSALSASFSMRSMRGTSHTSKFSDCLHSASTRAAPYFLQSRSSW